MKFIKNIVMLIALIGFAFNAQIVAAQDTETARDEYSIRVDGLGCPFCAYGLEKKFKEFKGIKNVQIDMETGEFTFTYPSDEALTLDQIETQVDKAGYTPVSSRIARADGSVEENVAVEYEAKVYDEDKVVSTSLVVAGDCDMCQARITKTAYKTEGVVFSEWDKKSKIFSVKYDPEVVDLTTIEQRISERGYDTENFTAPNEAYNNLPGCCQYKRNMVEKVLKKNAE